jgi:hypothetical protein
MPNIPTFPAGSSLKKGKCSAGVVKEATVKALS